MTPLSSIFSFSTLRANPARLLINRVFICTFASVLLVEIGTRVLIPSEQIPKGGFHNSEIRKQLQQFDEIHQLDLMIIGSSVAAVNFSPESIDTTLHKAGFKSFTSFNAGIRGCNFSCILEGVRTQYLSNITPTHALVVVGTVDIDDSNTTVVSRSADFAGSFTLPEYQKTFRNILSSVSWIYGFNEQIRSFIVNQRWNFDSAKVTVRGQVDMGNEQRRRYPDAPVFDAESQSFQALEQLVSLLKQRGVKVSLAPVLGDTLSRNKLEENTIDSFISILEKLAERQEIHLLSLPLGYMPDESYIDDIHMNPQGALQHGEYIANRLWQEGFIVE